MPLHPKGTLESKREPVGAAGYRLLVVLSMRRLPPAWGSAFDGLSVTTEYMRVT
jgi:hypothetical protein